MAEKIRILVVDDEEVVLQSVRKVLKPDDEHEFLIDTALSAEDGLALIEPGAYDVVVTDLMMPGIDGLQFIDRIKEMNDETRIVMITGYATMRTALLALRKGAFDYIAKPFTKEELRSVVKNAARLSEAPAREEPQSEAETAQKTEEDYRSFFNQTYVHAQPDGTVRFGVEPAFLATIGKLLSIEISRSSATVSQGFPFGSIKNADMRVFSLRAPLSGRILEMNQEAIDSLSLVQADPRGKGWLLHVEPSDFENEIENFEA